MPYKNSYSEAEKASAIARYVESEDLRGVASAMDIPVTTLRSWCRAAGLDVSTDASRARSAAATAGAMVARRKRVEESNGRMTLILATVCELAGRLEVEILRDPRAAEKLSLRDIVGARTRAIHDMQLLAGEATERTENIETVDEIAALRDTLRDRLSVVPNGAA